jgi:prephenate dehydrogenase
VWSDIYMDNRQALGEAIDDAIARLVEVRAVLEAGDDGALVRWSEQAAVDRARLGP